MLKLAYKTSYHFVAQLEFAEFYLNSQLGILLVYYYPNSKIDERKAQMVIETVEPILKQGVPYGLTDARAGGLYITREAREMYSDNASMRLNKKHAVVVNNHATRILATLFVQINKPITPTKVFNSINSAEDWLIKI